MDAAENAFWKDNYWEGSAFVYWFALLSDYSALLGLYESDFDLTRFVSHQRFSANHVPDVSVITTLIGLNLSSHDACASKSLIIRCECWYLFEVSTLNSFVIYQLIAWEMKY